MTYEFWGVRGTAPTPHADKVRYGGHTSCASLRLGPGEYIVIDAGTGLMDLGERVMAEAERDGALAVRIHLLLTHFHLDHILGLPFFRPLFSPRASIAVHAPAEPDETERLLAGLMSGRYFPVHFDETPAAKTFLRFEPGLTVGGVRVDSCPLRHPQGSVAYRLEFEGRTLVSATDTEHPESGLDARLAALASGADWLVYDAMYTPGEYAAGKRGWGHSTWAAGADLAAAAGVRTLVLAHLGPEHSDDRVDATLAAARERFPRTLAARQGLDLTQG
jgi:phosphoribosyl 1,2-cyclic phosphodiesterase